MEEELMLEDVCPIWSEKLKKGIDDLDRHILATDSRYCLVGEAWGFTGKQTGYFIAPLIPVVGCWTCLKYGRKFGLIAKKQKDCPFFAAANFRVCCTLEPKTQGDNQVS